MPFVGDVQVYGHSGPSSRNALAAKEKVTQTRMPIVAFNAFGLVSTSWVPQFFLVGNNGTVGGTLGVTNEAQARSVAASNLNATGGL